MVVVHSQTLSFTVELVGHCTHVLLALIILLVGQDTQEPEVDLTPTAH